jgi:glycosyltransferase involved in cell wall biosynthesis
MKIAILLATYNSERYISEQIESILNQTNHDWVLYIRDDGSTDKTLEIIGNYLKDYSNRIILIVDNKGALRSYYNFMELLRVVNADYYLFCDHDDVWLPNKIEITMNRMCELERNYPYAPVVVHTDMKVVDQQLKVLSESFWKYSRLLPSHCSFWELVSCNCVNGCTMLFNKAAKETVYGHESYCLMHDTLVAQSVAAAGGIISAVKEPTVLYRQHADNVIGASDARRMYFVRKIELIRSTYNSNMTVWKRACHIKQASFLFFLWTKAKISLLRFIK